MKYSTRNDRFKHYHKVPHRFELSLNKKYFSQINVSLIPCLVHKIHALFAHYLVYCLASFPIEKRALENGT